jgi:signal transduction histidine kinase
MTTVATVIAYLAAVIRCAGLACILAQLAIWHSFYTSAPWRLTAPVFAVAWACVMVRRLRGGPASPRLVLADSACYAALALAGQACVPPAVRDAMFSWLVIAQSGQLIVPAWLAPGPLAAALTLSSPAAYLAGTPLLPVTSQRTLAGATALLLVIGCAHLLGRRVCHRRAAAGDAELARADQAAREQYAVLSGAAERREQERLVHDTVLNTLTALARGGGSGISGAAGLSDSGAVLERCRRDVALIEDALRAPDDPAAPAARPGGLLTALQAVAAGQRAGGLTVHLDPGHRAGALPAAVITALSGAVREALTNVAEHAGTGEAWVTVGGTAAAGGVTVTVRDAGRGFDPAAADPARLGLRRSITERVTECGGQARIRSAPGQGTEVRLGWPAAERPTGGPGGATGSGAADSTGRAGAWPVLTGRALTGTEPSW